MFTVIGERFWDVIPPTLSSVTAIGKLATPRSVPKMLSFNRCAYAILHPVHATNIYNAATAVGFKKGGVATRGKRIDSFGAYLPPSLTATLSAAHHTASPTPQNGKFRSAPFPLFHPNTHDL